MAGETQQIYDMTKGEFVDMPVVETKVEQEEENNESEGESEEESKDEVKTEQGEKKDEDKSEEKSDEKTEDKKEEQQEEVVSPDDFVKTSYEEKFGIKTQAELDDLVEKAVDAMDELEASKKEIEELKLAKPKFANDQEEKAFNFIKKFDVSRQGEGLHTYGKLIGMDVEGADGKLLLEEQYVHQHPEWTREEAQRMFAKDFTRKYTIKKEDFDDEAAYQSELQDMETLKKGEIHRAKQYLKEQQEKYKPETKEKPGTPEAVTQSIDKHAKEYTQYAKDTNELSFEKDGSKFVFKLDDKKKAQLENAMAAWVKNPAQYNEKGQLLHVKNPKEMHSQLVGAMFMNDLFDVLYDQVKNEVSKLRVEEIAKTQPKKRSSPGAGDTNKKNDLYDSAAMLIKTRK